MEFGLSTEQRLLRDNIGGYLDENATLRRVRETADAKAPFDEPLLRGLVELGVFAVMVPEAYGGMGGGALDAALVQEQLGRTVAPVPFLGAAGVAVSLLVNAASPAQQREWLEKIAEGKALFGVALTENIGRRTDAGVRFHDGKLSGTATFVLDFGASHFLVADAESRLFIVPADQVGVRRQTLTTLDRTRAFGLLTFADVAAEPLGLVSEARAATRMAIALGRVLFAADTIGAAQMMIEKSISYSRDRVQFGRPIGSFQAVKHLCAEMAAELEPCHALMWYAAYVQEARPNEAAQMAGHAKSHTSEIGRFVARTATEVHGGIGLTEELGLHYWFKRIEINRQLLGPPEVVREEIAVEQWNSASSDASVTAHA
jgi:alkylation response protein AidB-like acyl-CoA dehydrogenase